MTLPTDPAARKAVPLATGCLDYFPQALCAVAECSQKGNDQHNPGKPLHWDRSKSGDESDALMRHFLQRGTLDSDGIRHSAKVAWRALALLEKEIEGEGKGQGQMIGGVLWIDQHGPDGVTRLYEREGMSFEVGVAGVTCTKNPPATRTGD